MVPVLLIYPNQQWKVQSCQFHVSLYPAKQRGSFEMITAAGDLFRDVKNMQCLHIWSLVKLKNSGYT